MEDSVPNRNVRPRVNVIWMSGLLVALMLAAVPRAAEASLLTPEYESRLEGWLGQDGLDFTNIYAKDGVGDSALEFHLAADGKGATFTLLEAIYLGQAYIIGGYDPQSWNSTDGLHLTAPDADRTAFIYNLTTGVVQRQRLSSDPYGGYYGGYQTFNWGLNGPNFGGDDLVVGSDLVYGTAYQGAYGTAGPCGEGGQNILGTSTYTTPCFTPIGPSLYFTVGALEVYTFTPNAEPLPDTANTLTLFGIAALGLAACRRYVS
jgi:hypothetical protein